MNGKFDYRLVTGTFLWLMLAIALAMRLHLIFVFEVNWDEFLNLAMIHDHARGTLHEPVQTAFVHLFAWLPHVAESEVDQVVAARILVFALNIGTSAFLYLICRGFMPVQAAVFAVLCYSTSYVFRHGTSLRTDPIATFFLMAALWLLIQHRFSARRALFAGALIGLAGAATIKSALYLPALGGVLLARIHYSENRPRELGLSLAATGSALAIFAVLLSLHTLTLSNPASPFAFVERTAGATLGGIARLGTATYLLHSVIQSPLSWIVLALGIAGTMTGALADHRGRPQAILLALATPLLSLLVYRDAYPYFYAFMLAAPSVLSAAGFCLLWRFKAGQLALLASILLGVSIVATYRTSISQDLSAQRQTLAAVHAIFPREEAYIDCCSMVSSHRKVGIFMSSWGMSDYYARGEPIMDGVLRQAQPRYLLANRHMLELDALAPMQFGREHSGLLQGDVQVLKDNFVHHWGAIYVLGKSVSLVSAEPRKIEIIVPGIYTLESGNPILVAGVERLPGSHLTLPAGPVRIQAVSPPAIVTLRWGADLSRPAKAPPREPLFRGF